MFTQKGILAVLFLSAAGFAVAMGLNGMYFTPVDGYTYQINTGDIQVILFCLMAACVGLFLLSVFALGVLPVMPGLESEKQEIQPSFTKHELIEMDREDEPHWNESHRQMASGSWNGEGDFPVYEDYRGWLRNAFTDEYIFNCHTDRRRVVSGKVSCNFECQTNGTYRYVGEQ